MDATVMQSVNYVRPEMKFKKEAVTALMTFKRKKTFKLEEQDRIEAMQVLLKDLAEAYNITAPVELVVSDLNGEHSGSSYVMPPMSMMNPQEKWVIVMQGKLSIITLLHEFGHVRGKGQVEAQVFALNLFRKAYSKAFEKLVVIGGMAYKRDNVPEEALQQIEQGECSTH